MNGLSELESAVDAKLKIINPRRYQIKGMKETAECVWNNRYNEVWIFTDYDVDGVCSTAAATLVLEYIGINLHRHVPRRFTDGYGLNIHLCDMVSPGALVITIDNGIAAIEPIKKLREKGCTVIILDHHLAVESGEIPPADHVVDPNAIPGQCEFPYYCGAGLVYKFAEEISKLKPIPEELMQEIQVLAGIATIADCVSLTGENWMLARSVYKDMELNKGLKALCKVMGDETHGEGSVGYLVAPCINAVGRLLDEGGEVAVKLLLSETDEEADKLAGYMKTLNENRKMLTARGVMSVADQLNALPADIKGIVVLNKKIQPGIVGIVAGRISERSGKPTVCLTEVSDDILKGSARSEGELNHLKKILDGCSDLLLGFGGHKNAAGLSLKKENLEPFMERFNALCVEDEFSTLGDNAIEIEPDEVDQALEIMAKAGPYGQDNDRIVVKVTEPITKNKAKTTSMGNGKYLKATGRDFSVMFFDEDNLPNPDDIANCSSLTVTGYLGTNVYKGKVSSQIESIKTVINY